VLAQYGIREGVLSGDDSDQRRAKRTTRIHRAHKVYDKKTGGYFNGQALVFLVLITPTVTLPVGFRFACPDPKQVAWRREEQRLKRLKVAKAQRPARPAADPADPSKAQLLLELIQTFRQAHPQVRLKAVLADALYGTQTFMDQASTACGGAQTISQLRGNQKVRFRGRERPLSAFFGAYPGVPQQIRRRGGEAITVTVSSARVHVCAHGKKRFVIALQYPGETEARYLVATDLSWRTLDIVQAYTLRWLVGVSGKGCLIQSVKVRPRPRDSSLVAWEAPWRESKTVKPSDNVLTWSTATYQVVTYSERGCSLVTRFPVAETVDNARRQQGPHETSPMRRSSPAGYQRRHGTKDQVSTGEARDVRRRKLAEEIAPITMIGKWRGRHPGGGSGGSPEDRRAAKRAGREAPGPVDNLLCKVRQG
jgi:hypothetical protein